MRSINPAQQSITTMRHADVSEQRLVYVSITAGLLCLGQNAPVACLVNGMKMRVLLVCLQCQKSWSAKSAAACVTQEPQNWIQAQVKPVTGV